MAKTPTTPQKPAQAAKQAVPRDTATFTPYYWEAYNEIVQPRRFNHYLLTRWLPELGAVGLAIVLTLRDRCYWHREDGVLRNETEVSMEELAASIGVERTTIHRQFKNNQSLALFVRKLAQYKMVDGKPRKIENAYMVSMDDPIHPDDYERYDLLRCAKETERQSGVRIKREDKTFCYNQQNGSTLQSATNRDSSTLQNATQPLQNATLNTSLQIATSNEEIPFGDINTLDNATGGGIPPINPPQGEGGATPPTWNNENPNTVLGGENGITEATATREEVWSSVKSRLEKPILLPLKLVDLTDTTATLATGDKWARDWLEDHKGGVLQAAFASVLGRGVELRFVAGGK
jgi:hypothetical protein